MKVQFTSEKLSQFVRMAVAPAALYFLAFAAMTWPRILDFSTHYLADAGDGFQNVWNLWWVRQAVVELGVNPWFTDRLHHPIGVSLLGQTLNPYNGFVYALLSPFLSLVQGYNFAVVSAFVLGGMGAFYLAHDLTRSWGGALLAGFVFAFSPFHFAHAEGHLQLVSLQWIPFFALFWIRLIEAPTVRRGILAALFLFLVILCDYYYFLYSFLLAVAVYAGSAWRRRDPSFVFRAPHRPAVLAFLLGATATSGLLVGALLRQFATDPLLGDHPVDVYSLDPLGLFVPGGRTRWAEWTRFHWSRLPSDLSEGGVYLGYSLLALIALAAVKRPKLERTSLAFWFAVGAGSLALALGPRLRLLGREALPIPLPYALLDFLPGFRLSGMPVRFTVVVTLAAAVIAAAAWSARSNLGRRARLAVSLLPALLFIEYLPGPIPATRVPIPGYVAFLRDDPRPGAVLDTCAFSVEALYHQTQHERPMAFGYVSRLPESNYKAEFDLHADVTHALTTGETWFLRDAHRFRFIIVDRSVEIPNAAMTLDLAYEDQRVRIYDLGPPPR